MLDAFGALAAGESRALGSNRWRPDPVTFEAGTRGSARCILSFRAKTSARTTDCCGSEHASGKKVGETAMLMKTTPMKPGMD